MVVQVLASKLNFPLASSSQISSLFYDPISLSLAFKHFDSSFSLFSPFTLSSPPPQTLISQPPSSSSSACFVSVNPNPNSPENTHVLFVIAGPYNGGSRVVLRFYLLGKDGIFEKTHVGFSQKGFTFDGDSGLVVDLSHGMKVLLVGSVNFLSIYSPSDGKVSVFGLKSGGDVGLLKLVKCAVIDCRVPVLSICISFGYLLLGEVHGVRIFPLRALVKGRVGSRRRSGMAKGMIESLDLKMPNGVDKGLVIVNSAKSKVIANGHVYNVLDGRCSNSNVDGNQAVKPKSLKLRQDSGKAGMQFVLFSDSIVEGTESTVPRRKTTKAISIQALSHQKFMILDSNGDLHVLYVSKYGTSKLRQLTGMIRVQQLAAFPDNAANTHTIWLSDGLNSVHKLVMPVTTNTENEHDMSITEGKIISSSVTEVIFTSESIQDMIPLAANTVLLLGQDSLFAYTIS